MKTPRAIAKDRAWESFSQFIRIRDCLRFTGDPDNGMCITCKRFMPKKALQAGHFVEGRGNAVLFDERIVYSQCGFCNGKPPRGLGGNYKAYTLFMIDEWGREKVLEFMNLKRETKQYKLYQFIEIEAEYKEKAKALLA